MVHQGIVMNNDYIFINEDGTVFNIINLLDLSVVEDMPDYKDKRRFSVSDFSNEECPGPASTYNFDTQTWTNPAPPTTSVVVENIVALEELAEDELAGGNS